MTRKLGSRRSRRVCASARSAPGWDRPRRLKRPFARRRTLRIELCPRESAGRHIATRSPSRSKRSQPSCTPRNAGLNSSANSRARWRSGPSLPTTRLASPATDSSSPEPMPSVRSHCVWRPVRRKRSASFASPSRRPSAVREYPDAADYQESLAGYLSEYALLLMNMTGHRARGSEQAQAVAIMDKLAREHEGAMKYQVGLADKLGRLGRYLAGVQRFAEALLVHKRSIAILEKLAADHPQDQNVRALLGARLQLDRGRCTSEWRFRVGIGLGTSRASGVTRSGAPRPTTTQ